MTILYVFFYFFVGCQSHSAAMQVICEAPTQCVNCRKVSPDMRLMATAQYIEKHVSNREAQKMMESLAVLSPSDKAQLVQKNAKKAGIKECLFTRMLEE